MKTANKELRKALMDTNKNYVEVVNENLELRRELESQRTMTGEAFKRGLKEGARKEYDRLYDKI